MKKRLIKCGVLALLTSALLSGICAYILISFQLNQYFPMTVWCSCACGLFLGLLRFRRQRDFEDIEHGSARWGTKKDFAPLADKDPNNTIILSKSEQLSMDGRKTNLSNHVLVLGDPGSGKSRNYVKPNVAQLNANYVITDPSGEHLFAEGKMLKDAGYKIRVFDVTNPQNSMRFNPLSYCKDPKDARKFIEVLMTNTSGDTSHPQHNEDFWIKSERLWFMAHIAYLIEAAPPEQRNIPSLVELLNQSMAKEEDENFKSHVDILFDDLEEVNPDSYAVKQYKKFKLAAGVVCFKRLLNQLIRKPLKTHSL